MGVVPVNSQAKANMACERCGFFNIPGTAVCVSCQTPLLARAPVSLAEITPPRAPGWQKFFAPRNRRMFLRLAAWRRRAPRLSLLLGVLPGVVPGLPQLSRNRTRRAAALGGAWIACILLAAHCFGTAWCNLFIGAALSIHLVSALLPYHATLAFRPLRQRAAISLLTYGALLVAIYLPLNRMIERYILPVRVAIRPANLPWEPGDTLLIRRNQDSNWQPERGAIVAYEFYTGVAIDRVLARAGDVVVVKDDVLTVNGQVPPPSMSPLAPLKGLPNGMLQIPDGQLFILDSASVRFTREANAATLKTYGLVRRQQLIGAPFMIYHPLSHRKRLK